MKNEAATDPRKRTSFPSWITTLALFSVAIAAIYFALGPPNTWDARDLMPIVGLSLLYAFRAVWRLIWGILDGGVTPTPTQAGRQSRIGIGESAAAWWALIRKPRFLRWIRNIFSSLLAVAVLGALLWLLITFARWAWIHPLFR